MIETAAGFSSYPHHFSVLRLSCAFIWNDKQQDDCAMAWAGCPEPDV